MDDDWGRKNRGNKREGATTDLTVSPVITGAVAILPVTSFQWLLDGESLREILLLQRDTTPSVKNQPTTKS